MIRKKYTIYIVCCLMYFVTFVSPVFATPTISITTNKTALFGSEELTITASTSGFIQDEKIYVKGAFFQEGSSNYFGLTKNGDTWIKNGDTSTNQRQVTIGNWDGIVITQSDFADSGYSSHGEGEYKFKLWFYYLNTTGSLVSGASNIVDIAITAPDPTATPIPTPSNTPTPKPVPTDTPTPTSKPTISVTSGISLIPSRKANPSGIPEGFILDDAASTDSADITLGQEDFIPTPTPVKAIAGAKTTENRWFLVFIILGMIFLGICGIVLYRMIKKGGAETEE